MLCDIMIVSHRGDLIWLYYCLRLLLMNWKEPGSRIIVRLEEDCRETVQRWDFPGVYYYYIKPWPDTYMFQMWVKMTSDDFTHADMLLMVDSDLMLMAPAKLEDFLHNGKPIIETLEWSNSAVAEQVWRAPVSRIMALDLDKDYMVRAPNLYWRETFAKTRQRIVQATGRSFFDAVYSSVPFDPRKFLSHPMTFADFECLNLYAATFERDRYFVRPQQIDPRNPFRLFWSHGDWSSELQAELEDRLALKK
jgi:hypothetical protein